LKTNLAQNSISNSPLYSRVGGTSEQLENEKIWKAAFYARLSKEDGDKDESDSIGNQKDLMRSFIRNQPSIIPTKEYEDDGYSGVNFDRPDFQRMLDDIRSGIINCVIVKDLSRLGRNYIETGKLLERFFPFMGVRFIAINDSYDSETHNSQTDNLIIPFKNLINDAYCADTSRKIRSQFEVKRRKGDFIGSFAAFGYMKDPENKNKLIIDEIAAPIIQDIFKWKIEGMSQQGIANRLNEIGVMSPLEYKKFCGSNYTTKFQTKYKTKWTSVAVGRILKNDLYIGVLTQGLTSTPNYKIKQRVRKAQDEWIRIENSHEAIVTPEDFALVARLLKKDTRIASGEDTVYLFSGMLICGDCGQSLVRKNVPSGNVKYVYHVCSTHKKGGGCKSHLISDKALYDAVFETIKFHISECAKISRLLEFIEDLPLNRLDVQKLQKRIAEKEAAIENLKKRKLKLYEDFSSGAVPQNDFDMFNDIYTAQITEENQSHSRIQQELDDITNNRTEKSLWIEYFKKYHGIQSLSRAAVVELIESITVFDNGKIEVTPRYQTNFEDAVRYISSLSDEGIIEERLVV